ncbi:hypothetical protein, partial [Halorubrum sp. CBA1125]|uniref:hypothetical protein n=1 Tax=Halorubrum sp. CBA1125 TaxID=2668072 RepID=UPI001E498463
FPPGFSRNGSRSERSERENPTGKRWICTGSERIVLRNIAEIISLRTVQRRVMFNQTKRVTLALIPINGRPYVE